MKTAIGISVAVFLAAGFTAVWGGAMTSSLTLSVCVIDPLLPIVEGQCPGGQGGGGGGGTPTGPSEVIFKGIAYPHSAVHLLNDGQEIAVIEAGPDANFEIRKTGIGAGTHIFSVWTDDIYGVRSALQSFPLSLSANVTTIVSGIFLPPTISVDKSEVARGDTIAFLGQTAPGAVVSLFVSGLSRSVLVNADARGVWTYKLDTMPLEAGTSTGKAIAAKGALSSSFSNIVSFFIGKKTVPAKPLKKLIGDLNDDGRVNLIDFSIEAYWYSRPGYPADFDLDGSGKIDLVDFSIMAYYWTG